MHENRNPGSPTALKAQHNRNGRITFPSSSLSLLRVPEHCILRVPKPVHIAHFTPIDHTPKPLQILLLAPHTHAGAHPRMLVDAEAHERAEVVTGAAEEPDHAELFVGSR